MSAEAEESKAAESGELTQKHPLIRSGEDYAAFWDQHAAQAASPPGPAPKEAPSSASQTIGRQHLRQIWLQASWLKAIEVFQLRADNQRRRRDDEIWLISPFTQEQRASMHVSLSANIYKDFSSGKGGGIMQFCGEMLRQQNREMTMGEVAQWMVATGISTANQPTQSAGKEPPQPSSTGRPTFSNHNNHAIAVDLRRYLRSDHPEWGRRGVTAATCRYSGC